MSRQKHKIGQRQFNAISGINITPLVDVLLILLIIMMLMMPLYVKKLPVQLPQTAIASTPLASNTLKVSLGLGKKLYFKGNPATLDDILKQVTPSSSIDLSVDKAVTYEDISRVIEALDTKKPRDIVLITN